ncbi:hypothetical protein AVEN_245033-1 [Araneus ventricosus]|uniref:RNase H type-1 domain-containing protein n=1 Tax=Araneus ventricosus TaxID=182803 RepID=A0A4Y2E9U5_ARAVE|nr:hypothetical protein AVEN_245033-1 [Araneus ventricosus]
MLYKTVIERIPVYGAAVCCLDPPVRIRRKLNTIQIPFLVALTGACRTTTTSVLQAILGIAPLYLQLQQKARVTAIRRLNISLPDTLTTLVPGEDEKGETGWSAHPAECPSEEQMSFVDGGGITSGTCIYTDDSKTKKFVGAAFCVWSGQNIVYRWLAKLQDYYTVFQAELLALKRATDHATSLPHQPITIIVDNQASVQAAANPRSINTTATEMCKSLITNKHIHISWIKAHVDYDRNEEADRFAKDAAESDRDPLSVKAPISFLKSIFKKKMMEDWQSDWEDEDTGRFIFNILPRVSTQPCYWKREKILFFTGHGPYPSYLKRFNLASTANCPCGNTNGTSLHYATACILTTSFHMTKPAQEHELICFRNVDSNEGSRLKIQRLLHHLNDCQELFRINPWSAFISTLFHYLQADMGNFLHPLRRSDSAPELFAASTQKNFYFMEKRIINRTDTHVL